jgi:hypothetical protein
MSRRRENFVGFDVCNSPISLEWPFRKKLRLKKNFIGVDIFFNPFRVSL